jgi:hypothetical protein
MKEIAMSQAIWIQFTQIESKQALLIQASEIVSFVPIEVEHEIGTAGFFYTVVGTKLGKEYCVLEQVSGIAEALQSANQFILGVSGI